ncbi:hypothetical protein TNCV_4987421 [Trichonephila clavipes]|nr:hypothetical protein TNCV_4987421 [Trichonephila clavipes]
MPCDYMACERSLECLLGLGALGKFKNPITGSYRQSLGISLCGGNWAAKLIAAIGIRLYGAALKRDACCRGIYKVCDGKTRIRSPLEIIKMSRYPTTFGTVILQKRIHE